MLNDVKEILSAYGFRVDQMSGDFIYCCSKQNIAFIEPFHNIDIYANILPGEDTVKFQVRFNRNKTTFMSGIFEIGFAELIKGESMAIDGHLEKLTIKAIKEFGINTCGN